MKTKLTLMSAVPALLLAFAGNAQDGPDGSKSKDAAAGAVEVAAIRATATVTAVDAAKRTVSLVNAAGETNTYKLGKAVRNFDQIKVGDEVKTTLIESVAVVARKSSAPPSAGEAHAVALAPKGDKPGVVMAETKEVTVKILSVDAKARTVTFEGPLGLARTIKVGPKAKLDELQKGDDVTLRLTEALAIVVEKP